MGLTEAAQALEEYFDEIFEDYKRRLREIGSLMIVGRDQPRATGGQCQVHTGAGGEGAGGE